MTRLYLVVGTAICALFIYAGSIGWKVIDPFGVGSARPKGPNGFYHK
jgi:hypothetical protein